jgi:hypothetical protein
VGEEPLGAARARKVPVVKVQCEGPAVSPPVVMARSCVMARS